MISAYQEEKLQLLDQKQKYIVEVSWPSLMHSWQFVIPDAIQYDA